MKKEIPNPEDKLRGRVTYPWLYLLARDYKKIAKEAGWSCTSFSSKKHSRATERLFCNFSAYIFQFKRKHNCVMILSHDFNNLILNKKIS